MSCMTTPTTGLRERKRSATRVALRAAAVRLAAERGIAHVTVDDIAAAADVSPRTFFNYFATKQDAVVGIDDERWQRTRAVIAAQPAGVTTLDALRAAFLDAAEDAVAGADEWRRRLDVIRSDPELLTAHVAAWSAAERSLVEAVAARTGLRADRDLYPSLVVSVALGAAKAAFLRWRADDAERSLIELMTEAFDSLADGVRDPMTARPRTSKGTP
jgi:AcrR family transcriptional regulator